MQLSDEDQKRLREQNRAMQKDGKNICPECDGYITLRYNERSDRYHLYGHWPHCSRYEDEP